MNPTFTAARRQAIRDARPDDCLHCAVTNAIEEWFEKYGRRDGDKVVLDVSLVISKLTEAMVDIIDVVPERSERRRAFASHTMRLMQLSKPSAPASPCPSTSRWSNDHARSGQRQLQRPVGQHALRAVLEIPERPEDVPVRSPRGLSRPGPGQALPARARMRLHGLASRVSLHRRGNAGRKRLTAPVNLVPRAKQVNDKIVDLLCEALIMAQRGEIVGVALAVATHDLEILTRVSPTENPFHLLGAVTVLEADIISTIRSMQTDG
jgi:hypothetical protein